MTLYRFCLVALLASIAVAQNSGAGEVQNVYSDAHAFYLDLHEHPELSGHEAQTATKLADRFRSAGYEVTEHVGGTGIVAVMKNGSGPTVMLRPNCTRSPPKAYSGLDAPITTIAIVRTDT